MTPSRLAWLAKTALAVEERRGWTATPFSKIPPADLLEIVLAYEATRRLLDRKEKHK